VPIRQEMHQTELRSIIEEANHLRSWRHPSNALILTGGLAGIVFPPALHLVLAGLFYSLICWWRHSHTSCPECGSYFFHWTHRGIVPVVESAIGWKCPNCGLEVCSLPSEEESQLGSGTWHFWFLHTIVVIGALVGLIFGGWLGFVVLGAMMYVSPYMVARRRGMNLSKEDISRFYRRSRRG
jgi:hypothetical protein